MSQVSAEVTEFLCSKLAECTSQNDWVELRVGGIVSCGSVTRRGSRGINCPHDSLSTCGLRAAYSIPCDGKVCIGVDLNPY